MPNALHKLFALAGIESGPGLAVLLERLTFVFLILMVLSAPHSIAATQTSWLLGMLFWIARFFVKPRPKIVLSFLAAPMLALFGWTVISTIFSYAPDISFGRLRSTTLFLIFFFVLNNLRTFKAVRLLATLLVFSTMVSVVWMPLERIIGKGILIEELSVDSPLSKAGFQAGYGLFAANGKRIDAPPDLLTEIEKGEKTDVRFYKDGHYWQFQVERKNLLEGNTPEARLGLVSWSKSRSWRSAGFYGHYATYAEVLQQIASLVFGLLIASLGMILYRRANPKVDNNSELREPGMRPAEVIGSARSLNLGPFNIPYVSVLLLFCVLLMSFVLLLTITRASQGGFLASAFLIVLIGGGRKLILALLVISIPAVLGAMIFLQQTRNVGFVDSTDSSTTWRLTVYREGLELWTKSPRNFIFGVGLDSIKRYAGEWRLFDDGRLQIGHFHSTPVQLVVERGLPALMFWLWFFGIYFVKLYRALKRNNFKSWYDKGIVLGAFGGAAGFFVSSLVHFNFGDGEVVMVLYTIMAFAVAAITPSFFNSVEIASRPGSSL